jgi:PIN domain nuclease of toxin-antitoxin system
MPNSLLLDTCAVLWLVSGDNRLSAQARDLIDTAPFVYVSPITAWEVSLKVAQGNLSLPLKPSVWFERVMKAHHLEWLPLSPDILIHANELPWHHRDPADRFILASALLSRLDVVTADTRYAAYGVTTLI